MDILSRYAQKNLRTVIGLMSGTSADGIDVALTHIAGSCETISVTLDDYAKVPYEQPVKRAIFALFSLDAPLVDICRINFALGRLFAQAASDMMNRHGLGAGEVDLIASHGQTICHLPPGGPISDKEGSTLQIGEPAVIAELTGVTVVADFRPRDMAAGGQGAPLVPYADYALFHHPNHSRAIQNIGGIANVTYLPSVCNLENVIAFDTGPGNMIMDALVRAFTDGKQSFDRDGEMAALGRVDESLLEWLMGHEFVRRPPPKSTGREQFGASFVSELLQRAEYADISAEDLLTTATAFTAESIAANYRAFLLPKGPINEVILGGGGSYNTTLRRMLKERLPGTRILLHEDFGIRSDAKEALSLAILGNETMLGQPANIPGVTGARKPVILGKIIPA